MRNDELDRQLHRLERRLPRFAGRAVRWTRKPVSKWIRIPLAIALIVAGAIGTFLPVLGFWMIPVGLVLLAQEIPALRSPLARALAWINRKWPGSGSARADAG